MSCARLKPGTTKYALQRQYHRDVQDGKHVPEKAGVKGVGKTAALLFWEKEFTEWWAAKQDVQLKNDPPVWSTVYIIWARNPDTHVEEVAYVGITTVGLDERLERHSREQPWWDLKTRHAILHQGMMREWQREMLEQEETERHKPVYPWEGQEVGAPHAVPKPVAMEQREAREAERHLHLVGPEG
jgi:hypothetical protein